MPFRRSSAFLMGNEGQGLSEKEKAICDSFVYMPQYQTNTASLNVCVATSIVLHHFAKWAGYEESEMSGDKFDLKIKNRRELMEAAPEEVLEAREKKR